MQLSNRITLAVVLHAVAWCGVPAHGHFVWLSADAQNRAELFFGESPADRDYHLPESITEAKILFVGPKGEPTVVKTSLVEEDNFVGLRAAAEGSPTGYLETKVVYGLFHGSKLTYHARHLLSHDPKSWPAAPTGTLDLEMIPSLSGEGLAVKVFLMNQPAAKRKVTLLGPDGKEVASVATNDEGVALFKSVDLSAGLFGLMVNQTNKEEKGEWMGEKFNGAAHYGTLTFSLSGARPALAASSATAPAVKYPELPEPLASFGGAVLGPWLYVYSGHLGKPHDHSKDNLSPHFRRLSLTEPHVWEDLPAGPALQGVPLVPCAGKLYRIGGLSANNPAGMPEDLHSVASVSCFDPETKQWSEMPPLPESRSSHDAIALGSTIYVAGGWNLEGDDQTWLDTAYKIDVSAENPKWEAIANPPFRRRAIATVIADGKLAVIGGMTDDNKPSDGVDLFDLKTNEWSKGPGVPCGAMKAFGASAAAVGNAIYVSTHDKQIHRLRVGEEKWEKAGELDSSRIFHRLLPLTEGGFVVAGGATGFDSQVTSVIKIELP